MSKVSVTTHVDEKMYSYIMAYAKKHGVTKSEAVRMLLDVVMMHEEKKPEKKCPCKAKKEAEKKTEKAPKAKKSTSKNYADPASKPAPKAKKAAKK